MGIKQMVSKCRGILCIFGFFILITFFAMIGILISQKCAYPAEPRAVWDASPGAIGYIAYYTDGATEYHAVATETNIALALLDMAPCKEYRLTVSAFNDAGESGRSNEVTWKTPCWTPPTDQKPIHITIPSGVTVTIQAE